MKYQGSLITHCEGQTTCHRTPDFILVPTSKRPITDDYAKAYMDIKNLAERGIPRAQYNLGAIYTSGQGVPQDYAEAVKWYRKAAKQGIARAQFNLGVAYASGQGVLQDYTEAATWFRKAAEQGIAQAQYNLGAMYTSGQGVPQDYAEAVNWYRKAAEQGIAKAQYNLGAMYDQGEGVSQDYAEAVKWYRKAADQGDPVAQHNLGLIYYTGQGVAQDYSEAVKWTYKVAQQGNADAQKNLGHMYHEGLGVPKDYVNALKWYREAAEQREAGSQAFLAWMYHEGQGTSQDYAEAVKWYHKAPQQGDTDAQYNLGLMYDFGRGVPQDYNEAVNWYRKAAEQGIAKAQYNLAAMYASGQGVPKQSGLAKLLYTIRQIELLNRDLDGFKDFGAHFQSIDQRLQKAAQDCLVLRDKMNARYLAACEKFEKEVEMPIESWFGQDVSLPGKDAAVSRDQAWSTFACMQNKTTLRILRPYYNEDNFSYIARIMTPPEKKLFEKHVAHFRYYKKAIWRLQFELTGVHPLEVQGVYWPIKLVCQITDDTKALRSKSAIKNLFASTIDSPVGPLNLRFERARKGTINPASLSYTWILPQLHQIARWLTFAKPIRDIQKIITHPEWVGTVVNTRGRAWYDHYMRYLQDLATLPFGTLDQMAGSEIKAPG